MKEKIKTILWLIFKAILSVEYVLGFIPCMVVYYFSKIFKKPKTEKDFYKRILYIQAFVFPIIIGAIIAFLVIFLESLTIDIIAIIVAIFYCFGIRYAQYEKDPYIKILSERNNVKRDILTKRLINIKYWVFLSTLFIIGFLLR